MNNVFYFIFFLDGEKNPKNHMIVGPKKESLHNDFSPNLEVALIDNLSIADHASY